MKLQRAALTAPSRVRRLSVVAARVAARGALVVAGRFGINRKGLLLVRKSALVRAGAPGCGDRGTPRRYGACPLSKRPMPRRSRSSRDQTPTWTRPTGTERATGQPSPWPANPTASRSSFRQDGGVKAITRRANDILVWPAVALDPSSWFDHRASHPLRSYASH